METVFTVLKYFVFGFFGLIGLIIVIGLVFGKRIKKQWEYEAEFRDADGREFGEFEIESSRIQKEEPDYTLKVEFRMRHPSLAPHQTIQVFLEDTLVVEGIVTEAGRIFLGTEHLQNRIERPSVGQLCRVVSGGQQLFAEPLQPD